MPVNRHGTAWRLVESPGVGFFGYAQAAGGYCHALNGYYRFLNNGRSELDLEKLLQSHSARTLRRMSRERTAFIVQNSSDLNFSTRRQCQGLGQIGTNQTGAKSRGLRLHSSLALSQNGLPLRIVKLRSVLAWFVFISPL